MTLAFCLMPNHVHFLVQTPEADLGDGIAVAHWRYAIHLNRKVDATGHLFDDRFSNKLVLSDEHLTANLRPIPRNPVPSLCDHPEAWDWSSHNATAGTAPVPSWLAVEQALGHLHEDVEVARAAYLRLRAQSDEAVLQALACGARDDRWMVIAHDLHRIPVETLAAFIGRATSTTYRRLATARETQVTGT